MICGQLVTQRDSETWHHCVEVGGPLEIAALESVGFADFQGIIFNVRHPSQETALKLLDVLCIKRNQRDGDKMSRDPFCAAARKWLTLSVKHKFRQLSEAIVGIRGMENESFNEAMISAAIVDWDDLFRQWLEREKQRLHNQEQRYQFAQYLSQSLRYNSSLKLPQTEIILREIGTNSATTLRQCDRMLASRVDSIIRQIRKTRAREAGLLRALTDVRFILP
ncbi:hypothetical protein ASPNIDRAFT_183713, partial [Aspergillus niger ATCC 1015]